MAITLNSKKLIQIIDKVVEEEFRKFEIVGMAFKKLRKMSQPILTDESKPFISISCPP